MAVACPLCCSRAVQCAVVTDLILVCVCVDCHAQFTIQKRPEDTIVAPPSPSVPRPLEDGLNLEV